MYILGEKLYTYKKSNCDSLNFTPSFKVIRYILALNRFYKMIVWKVYCEEFEMEELDGNGSVLYLLLLG